MASNNIEDGIIGCILVDPECLFQIYDKIKPEMFNYAFCRNVYQKMLSLYDRGIRFDATILANEMANENSDADVFMNQFSNLVMECPGSWLLKEYTDKLIANYQSKRLNLLLKEVDSNPTNIKDTIGNLITRLEEIQTNEKEKSHTLAEIVKANKDNYFNGTKKVAYSIGLDKLDEVVSLVPGDVTVIAARPKVGKSAFVTQLAKKLAREGLKIGYFNLEMVESQVYERLVASESQISLVRIKKANNFLGEEKSQFDQANESLEKLNIVVSTGSKTDLDIKAECRHQNFNIIIIDYLQLVRCHKRCENKRVEVGEVSRNIKALAMELNVPVVLLSQLSRRSEYTADKEPSSIDLRESGDIEQDASAVILMWNLSDKPEYKEFKGIKVDLNRQGETMSEALDFLGETMTFVETKESLDEVKKMLGENRPTADDDNPFVG